MKPFLVLCTYKPSKWRARTVGQELTAITQELGLLPHIDSAHGPLSLKGRNWVSHLLHAEVRRRTFKTNQAESFHYDADLTPGGNPNCAIVLWASNHPTEIKWQSNRGSLLIAGQKLDTIWTPKPYELVIFHNRHCLHRRPEGVPRMRWVFRQRVAIPSHMELP